MLKYPCLVLDHDDTVVQSEKTIGYPFFCKILEEYRPGVTITFRDYVHDCHNIGFANMCRMRFNFNDYESLNFFQRVLVKNGVIDLLRKEGIEEGDTVSIYDFEFDFVF